MKMARKLQLVKLIYIIQNREDCAISILCEKKYNLSFKNTAKT